MASSASVADTADYVIIGGGTAGLAIASRLASDSLSRILVLEAGPDLRDRAEIHVPAAVFANMVNPDFCWDMVTTPQEFARGRVIPLQRGKGLGGSSLINMMQSLRSSAGDYDAWEMHFGNKGWNWTTIMDYFKKIETFTTTAEKNEGAMVNLDPRFHGASGPLPSSLPTMYTEMHKAFFQAMNELGIPTNPDPNSGDIGGVWTSKTTIDPVSNTRCSSATAYLEPVRTQPNLVVTTGAHVSRIVLKESGGLATATGVEFIKNGEKKFVAVAGEVIVCAGTYLTPQVLELSGIGDPTVLRKFGIPIVADLPGVGNNFQDTFKDKILLTFAFKDHLYVTSGFKLKDGYTSYDALQNPERLGKEMETFQSTQGGLLSTLPFDYAFVDVDELMGNSGSLRAAIKTACAEAATKNSYPKVLKVQEELTPTNHTLELMQISLFIPAIGAAPYEPGNHYFSLVAIVPHPVSRGSVHIQSADPLQIPKIDTRYLESQVDVDVLVEGVKFSRKLAQTEPLRSMVVSQNHPLPVLVSNKELEEYVRANAASNHHPIGTAAMLPRTDGGVVDNELRVYGTANVRVADASIIPLQLASHTQLTVYAIAERLADMILEAAKRGM